MCDQTLLIIVPAGFSNRRKKMKSVKNIQLNRCNELKLSTSLKKKKIWPLEIFLTCDRGSHIKLLRQAPPHTPYFFILLYYISYIIIILAYFN